MYWKWKKHNGFSGTRLRSIERDNDGNILNIPDGIVFPILSSLSEFVKKQKGTWTYSPPKFFNEDKLIESAKNTYIEIANSNPAQMGKSKACYSALSQITQIYNSIGN
jgi:hypothetical protein